MATCSVCFRHCELREGQTGFCGARVCEDGIVRPANYGRITSLALDPIEKKPLSRFRPGSRILSVGSYGCNLRCPFCQNYEISWSAEAMAWQDHAHVIGPDELVSIAQNYRSRGNIGIAFTYNEPLIGWEFIRDTARLSHEQGMVNVLVTNGTAELSVLEEILPYIDAMNIDLKGFTDHYYRDVLGGDLDMVKAFIERSVRSCHVELTTLIVPGENDSEEEMRALSSWIAGLDTSSGSESGRETPLGSESGRGPAAGMASGADVPLHISRFFPQFHMVDRRPTNVRLIYRLAEVAREKLRYVYTGNC